MRLNKAFAQKNTFMIDFWEQANVQLFQNFALY